jgi:hypothetical protein
MLWHQPALEVVEDGMVDDYKALFCATLWSDAKVRIAA